MKTCFLSKVVIVYLNIQKGREGIYKLLYNFNNRTAFTASKPALTGVWRSFNEVIIVFPPWSLFSNTDGPFYRKTKRNTRLMWCNFYKTNEFVKKKERIKAQHRSAISKSFWKSRSIVIWWILWTCVAEMADTTYQFPSKVFITQSAPPSLERIYTHAWPSIIDYR